MEKKEINRRDFMKKSTLLSAGLGSATILKPGFLSSMIQPSDKINVALIGCRSMGFRILEKHLSYDDVNCVAMCDVDKNVLEERAAEVKNTYEHNPKLYKDYRKMLEQRDIDAVIIGTPDHWHCLQLIESLQAGKDVYVEKPMANTIEECNLMVKATNYYERVVQVGQQQRSNKIFIDVRNMVKSGLIGSLRKVNIWANFNYGLGAEPAEDSPVPDGVDYDMWLGPAPKRPYNRARFHGTWRHFWDYGGGMFSDWGVHLIDMGLWVTSLIQAPTQLMTFGGNNSTSNKMRETFDTMNVIYPTKDFVINYDMTAGVQDGPYDFLYGVAFVGDKATIKAHREGYKIIPEYDHKNKKWLVEAKEFKEGQEAHAEHVRNFIDCVKSRKTPICPPDVGRAVAIHVHAANISARIGEPFLEWDDENNCFSNSDKANDYIVPEYRKPWELPKVG